VTRDPISGHDVPERSKRWNAERLAATLLWVLHLRWALAFRSEDQAYDVCSLQRVGACMPEALVVSRPRAMAPGHLSARPIARTGPSCHSLCYAVIAAVLALIGALGGADAVSDGDAGHLRTKAGAASCAIRSSVIEGHLLLLDASDCRDHYSYGRALGIVTTDRTRARVAADEEAAALEVRSPLGCRPAWCRAMRGTKLPCPYPMEGWKPESSGLGSVGAGGLMA
jgi:hypothetical protein